MRPLNAGFSAEILPGAACVACKWRGCCETIYTKDAWYLHVISPTHVVPPLTRPFIQVKSIFMALLMAIISGFFLCLCRLLPQASPWPRSLAREPSGAKEGPERNAGLAPPPPEEAAPRLGCISLLCPGHRLKFSLPKQHYVITL